MLILAPHMCMSGLMRKRVDTTEACNMLQQPCLQLYLMYVMHCVSVPGVFLLFVVDSFMYSLSVPGGQEKNCCVFTWIVW